jgi:HAD superfamily hydrolase (TIGR01509 family)
LRPKAALGEYGFLNRKKVIVYDCDGALFDSKLYNEAFYRHILRHFGLPELTPDQLDLVHVSAAQEAVDRLFEASPLREKAQAYRVTVDIEPLLPLMRLEPNVREVLSRLRPAYRTAIATNRGYSMPVVLRHHDLDGLFDMTVTSLDVERPKPDPGYLLKVLDRFKVQPRETIYVGDAEVDRLVAE